MNKVLRGLGFMFVAAVLLCEAQAQLQKENIPVIQGDAGPCSLALTVVGSDGKPVYAATIKVRIAYGFGGMHKLDLEAGTNSDGKVRFDGLPRRVSRPPLQFRVSKDELQAVVEYDPSVECQSKRDVALDKLKAQNPN